MNTQVNRNDVRHFPTFFASIGDVAQHFSRMSVRVANEMAAHNENSKAANMLQAEFIDASDTLTAFRHDLTFQSADNFLDHIVALIKQILWVEFNHVDIGFLQGRTLELMQALVIAYETDPRNSGTTPGGCVDGGCGHAR